MLPQPYRLRLTADLKRVRQQGRSWRHPLIVLLVHKNAHDVSRFAFIVSRRIGNAVTRNRIKRLLRESIHRHLAEIKPGWDCVIIARSQMPQVTFNEVERAVLQLLKRAKLLVVNKRTGDG